MSCLKHLPFLHSPYCCCITFRVESSLSQEMRGDCWSAIIHFPLVKVINWGWKSLHMDGHNLFSWKGFPLVNWKMIISLEAAGKTSSLPKSQLSIPPKKESFTIICWCSCHLKLMTAFFFSSASLEAGDSSGRRWPVCWRIFGTLSDWHQTRARLPGQWR